VNALAIIDPDMTVSGLAEAHRLFENCVEHRREIAERGIDDLQYLSGRSLAGERLVAFRVADGKLTFEIGDPLLGVD
jgi:hypothetical protein